MAAPAGFIREHQLSRATRRRSTMAWPRLPGARPQLPASQPCSHLQNGSTGSSGRLRGGGGCRSRDGRCWRWGGHWAVPGWLGWTGPIRAGCREVWRDDVHGVRTGGSLGHAPPLLARSPPQPCPPAQELVGAPWPRAPSRRWQSGWNPMSPTPAQVGPGWMGTGLPPHPRLGYTGVTGPQCHPPRGAGAG